MGFVSVWSLSRVSQDGRAQRAVCVRAAVAADVSSVSVQTPPVYFVLGGPGSGKGTQCKRLVEQFGFIQVGAGDLLRKKAKQNDEVGSLVAECIKTGKIVPGHITMELLNSAIRGNRDCSGILIDGFPREINQARDFERLYAKARAVIFFECSNEELKNRLRNRGLTSGRVDDDDEVIEKRLITFRKTTMPVVQYFEHLDRLNTFDAERTMDAVFQDLASFFEEDLTASNSSFPELEGSSSGNQNTYLTF